MDKVISMFITSILQWLECPILSVTEQKEQIREVFSWKLIVE